MKPFLIASFCYTNNLIYGFHFDDYIKHIFIELSKYIQDNNIEKTNKKLAKFILENNHVFEKHSKPTTHMLVLESNILRSIYKKGFAYPIVTPKIMEKLHSRFFHKTRIYYNKKDDVDIIKMLALIREPTNIAGHKNFSTDKMMNTYGWADSYYDTFYKDKQKLAPNIGVYCHTPLVPGHGRRLAEQDNSNNNVHLYNAIGYAFDSYDQTDYQALIEPGVNKNKLRDRYKDVFEKIYMCAQDQNLSHVIMSLVGGNNFASLYNDDKGGGIEWFFRNYMDSCIYACV